MTTAFRFESVSSPPTTKPGRHLGMTLEKGFDLGMRKLHIQLGFLSFPEVFNGRNLKY